MPNNNNDDDKNKKIKDNSRVNDKASPNQKKEDKRLNELSGREWIKHTISWFTLSVRPRTREEIKHPGKYPEELCERFIRFFTKRTQWVIDPFLGVGSTLVAARTLGRNGVGIELNPEFAAIARKNLKKPSLEAHMHDTKQLVIEGDSTRLADLLVEHVPEIKYHLCMTSPPYWNMLRKQRGGSDSQHRRRKEKGLALTYGDLPGDLEHVDDYNEYLAILVDIFSQLKPFMAPRAYIVIVIQNILDADGTFYPLAWDLARDLSKSYRIRQEQIWCQNDKPVGIWGYPTTYVSNVHHHYCLIFQNT